MWCTASYFINLFATRKLWWGNKIKRISFLFHGTVLHLPCLECTYQGSQPLRKIFCPTLLQRIITSPFDRQLQLFVPLLHCLLLLSCTPHGIYYTYVPSLPTLPQSHSVRENILSNESVPHDDIVIRCKWMPQTINFSHKDDGISWSQPRRHCCFL